MKFHQYTRNTVELPNGNELELPFAPEDWLQGEVRIEEQPDGTFKVAYLDSCDYCENPLNDCGMGTIWHHPRSHYGKSDGYYDARGLDSYGEPRYDEDKLQQMWHDAVMAVPLDAFRLDGYEDSWPEQLRKQLANEEVGDYSLSEQCKYAWVHNTKSYDVEVDDEDEREQLVEQVEPHLKWNYLQALDTCQIPMSDYAVLLDVYDHSGRSYSLSGGGMQCRWDTSRVEACWIGDDKYTREEIDRRAKVYAFGKVVERGYRSTKKYAAIVDQTTTKFIDEPGGEIGEFEHWHEAYETLQVRVANFGVPSEDQQRRGHNRALYEIATNAVDQYDAWQSGEHYTVITLTCDAEGNQIGDWDSCGGYIGLDYAREERDSFFKVTEPEHKEAA